MINQFRISHLLPWFFSLVNRDQTLTSTQIIGAATDTIGQTKLEKILRAWIYTAYNANHDSKKTPNGFSNPILNQSLAFSSSIKICPQRKHATDNSKWHVLSSEKRRSAPNSTGRRRKSRWTWSDCFHTKTLESSDSVEWWLPFRVLNLSQWHQRISAANLHFPPSNNRQPADPQCKQPDWNRGWLTVWRWLCCFEKREASFQ